MEESDLDILEVYNNVEYRINNDITFKVGDCLSDTYKNSGFITAYNPFGKKHLELHNTIKHRELLDEVISNNYKYVNGYGSLFYWREEHILIHKIKKEQMDLLMVKYEQLAYIYIDGESLVKLVINPLVEI